MVQTCVIRTQYRIDKKKTNVVGFAASETAAPAQRGNPMHLCSCLQRSTQTQFFVDYIYFLIKIGTLKLRYIVKTLSFFSK